MNANRHARRVFSRERVRAVVARREFCSNPLVLLLAFLALAIQLFVVQTHIHIDQVAPGAVAAIPIDGANAPGGVIRGLGDSHDRSPIKDDSSNCPLCQAFSHSGQFVQSAQVLLSLPAFVSSPFAIFSEALPSRSLLSHSWQGRAPPQS